MRSGQALGVGNSQRPGEQRLSPAAGDGVDQPAVELGDAGAGSAGECMATSSRCRTHQAPAVLPARASSRSPPMYRAKELGLIVPIGTRVLRPSTVLEKAPYWGLFEPRRPGPRGQSASRGNARIARSRGRRGYGLVGRRCERTTVQGPDRQSISRLWSFVRAAATRPPICLCHLSLDATAISSLSTSLTAGSAGSADCTEFVRPLPAIIPCSEPLAADNCGITSRNDERILHLPPRRRGPMRRRGAAGH